MKTIKLSAVILSFGLFIFGCGNNEEEISKKTSEILAEKIIENSTGADIDINQDGEQGSITIKGEDGEEVTFSGGTKEMPDNFPDDIYVAEGEIISSGSIKSGEGEVITLVIGTDSKIEDLISKVRDEMKSKGWKEGMNMTTGEGGLVVFSKNDNSLTVTFAIEDNQAQAAYMVTVQEKK